jgi:hypothetical protein
MHSLPMPPMQSLSPAADIATAMISLPYSTTMAVCMRLRLGGACEQGKG